MAHQSDRLREALSDRYRIERELGSGGMATVYLAEDLKHHRQVAVKVLRPELTASIGVDRFLREIEIAARLTHPHVLSLHDSGNADGFLYYVMPYVSGGSLRDCMSRERQLPVEDALRITREVAEALDHAHSQGIVHRDIKPENIMFEGGHAIVADFGVARAVSQAGGEKLTETGIAIGTPHYMSPEQASGDSVIDGRADVYALGCVLHEMLAGETPFDGPTAEVIIRKHLSMEPPRITTLRPAVPEPVAEALLKALAKTPADRHTTAGRFTDALAIDVAAFERRLRVRKIVSWAAAAAAVIVAVVAATLLLPRGSGGALDPNRVLVVEFTDNSGREETAGLGSWAQDYIIQVLTDAGFAKVVDPLTARDVSQNVAAAGVAGGPGDILALADEARAGTVVSGSYYTARDSIYIQTRITGAGELLATVGPVVGSSDAIPELFGRLGQEVVATLASLLNQDIRSLEPRVQTASYEAFQAYSDGLDAYGRDFAEAARHFERAAAADPTFHRATLLAAQSYTIVADLTYDWPLMLKAESLWAPLLESPGELSRYERCKLDFVIALRQSSLRGHYEAARCMAEEAPGSASAKLEVALALMRLNHPAEAIQRLRELRGLKKTLAAQYWENLGQAYHMLGDYERELDVAHEGRQRFPENTDMLVGEANALAALGRLDALAAVLDSIRSAAAPDNLGWQLMPVALELRAHGHRDRAREVLNQWIQSRQQQLAPLAVALYNAERWEDAQRAFEAMAELGGGENLWLLNWLGRLAARRGDRAEVARITELHRSSASPFTIGNTLLRARVAALLGEPEEAMTLLQHYFDLVPAAGAYVLEVHRSIDFESLHDYPPFQEFLRPKG